MSLDILNRELVLKLNKGWNAVGFLTPAAAFTFLCSERDGDHPGFALDYEVNADGDLVYANPVTFDVWRTLPIRHGDLSVGIGPDHVTGEPRRIRVPLVVICANYADIPVRTVHWSPNAIRVRDNDTCQATGRKLKRGEGNTAHIVARARGGKDTFTNTVYMDKKLNTAMGTLTPEEAGIKLLRSPKAPPVGRVVHTKKDAKHPTQVHFLI